MHSPPVSKRNRMVDRQTDWPGLSFPAAMLACFHEEATKTSTWTDPAHCWDRARPHRQPGTRPGRGNRHYTPCGSTNCLSVLKPRNTVNIFSGWPNSRSSTPKLLAWMERQCGLSPNDNSHPRKLKDDTDWTVFRSPTPAFLNRHGSCTIGRTTIQGFGFISGSWPPCPPQSLPSAVHLTTRCGPFDQAL